jgi:hypothetical protein
MNWKGFQGSGRGIYNFQALSRHSPGATKRNHEKTLSQDSWYPDRDLNRGPPEYEAVVLRTSSRRSVTKFISFPHFALSPSNNVQFIPRIPNLFHFPAHSIVDNCFAAH